MDSLSFDMAQPFNPDPARVLAAVLNASGDAAFVVDLEGRIQSCTPAAATLLDYDADRLAGRSVSEVLQAGHVGGIERVIEQVRQGQAVEPYDTCLIGRGGQLIHVTVRVSPVEDGSGLVVGCLLATRNIEERIRNEMAMQTADARWHALIDAAVDGMIVIDSRGSIEAFNPAAVRLFGYRTSDVLGHNVRMLMPSPDREQHDRYLARYLETGAQKIIGIGRDVTALRSDGTRFPVHLAVGEMRVANEPHFVGIVHDLTARMKLEAQVREQTSLARLGEMAAVLAHEVRNPLAAVRGAIQVLGKRHVTEGRDQEVVKEILNRLDGLNALVQDLLLFARAPKPKLVPIELRLVLAATTELLAKDPLMTSIQVEIDGEAPPIAIDADLMKIAFQNIILNAAQALQGQGWIRASIAAGPDAQVIAIRDSGPGMSEEARARLFQPFFTTKARGTGLGLATVRRIIEAHNGSVAVDTPPDGGTVVTIELPVRRQPVAA